MSTHHRYFATIAHMFVVLRMMSRGLVAIAKCAALGKVTDQQKLLRPERLKSRFARDERWKCGTFH